MKQSIFSNISKYMATIPSNNQMEEKSGYGWPSRTEGLVDREVSLDDEHGCSHHLRLLKDMATPPVQDTIDTTYCHFRTLGGKGGGGGGGGGMSILVGVNIRHLW